jgi:Na+/proline symporter
VYATSEKIGSPKKMHELLSAASKVAPIAGNAHGSYLTMRSKNGLIFGVINIIGNFATVFQDQAYWQRAIASRPASTVKAYLLGGLAWSVNDNIFLSYGDLFSFPGSLFPSHLQPPSGWLPLPFAVTLT